MHKSSSAEIDIGSCELTHIFALGAIAALAREDAEPQGPGVFFNLASAQARFAVEVGMQDAITGHQPMGRTDREGQSVCLRRVTSFTSLEAQSRSIAKLVSPSDQDTQDTIKYVLTELLRNVLQHSRDSLGAIAGAHLMRPGYHYEREAIQVVVADCGMGIPSSLSATQHEELTADTALEMALHPHVSGAFMKGNYGSSTNAGLGLFFISEIAKRAPGSLMIATRGGSLYMEGDKESNGHHVVNLSNDGYPGTLVAFEIPIGTIYDYTSLIELIQKLAQERQPLAGKSHIKFSPAPSGALTILCAVGAEDTEHAFNLRKETLSPTVSSGKALCFDFQNLRIVTQSYLHTLLHDPLREAHSSGVPIHAIHCAPAIVSALRFLESYALARTD